MILLSTTSTQGKTSKPEHSKVMLLLQKEYPHTSPAPADLHHWSWHYLAWPWLTQSSNCLESSSSQAWASAEEAAPCSSWIQTTEPAQGTGWEYVRAGGKKQLKELGCVINCKLLLCNQHTENYMKPRSIRCESKLLGLKPVYLLTVYVL